MSVGLWGAPPTPQSILMGEGLVSPPSNPPPKHPYRWGFGGVPPAPPSIPMGQGAGSVPKNRGTPMGEGSPWCHRGWGGLGDA